MTDKYAELRRLAESATPGPWESVKRSEYDGSYYFLIQTQEERNGWEIAEIRMDVPHDNAAFIAAANPSTILSLLDELVACRKDAERLSKLDGIGYAYGFEDMHEGNRWMIEGPFRDIRAAIDAMQEQKP